MQAEVARAVQVARVIMLAEVARAVQVASVIMQAEVARAVQVARVMVMQLGRGADQEAVREGVFRWTLKPCSECSK